MAATPFMKIFTGTDAGTMNPSADTDATNWNLMSIDSYDSTGTDYQSNPITVLESGTAYSFEKWIKIRFDGTYNLIENVKVWKSAGTLSDGSLALNAGETATGVTPTDSASSVATAAIPTTEGTAIDITPTANIDTDGDFTDFLVVQLEVPDTVTTPGDIGTQTLTFQYDES